MQTDAGIIPMGRGEVRGIGDEGRKEGREGGRECERTEEALIWLLLLFLAYLLVDFEADSGVWDVVAPVSWPARRPGRNSRCHGEVVGMVHPAVYHGEGEALPQPPEEVVDLDEHTRFEFMFGAAFAHELCHVFVCFLAGESRADEDSYTPPAVTAPGYSQHLRRGGGAATIRGGESGRWVEQLLYGGNLEFFRDVGRGDGDEQVRMKPPLQ
jgi:hypothetical protein